MKRIRIAQIGTAHAHARDIFDSMLAQDSVFDVVGYALCDGEESSFDRLPKDNVFTGARRMDLKELFSELALDAVTIECTETDLTRYAMMAAKRGLHIHIDKPGGEDEAAFRRLIGTCRKRHLVFHPGYMYRYNPAVIRALELVVGGALGRIFSVQTEMSCLLSDQERARLASFRGGMMFYLGCHLVDLIFAIQGAPDRIEPLNQSTMCAGVDGVDFGFAVFIYKNGISFAHSSAVEAGGGMRRQIVIEGEKGVIEIRPIERWLKDAPDRRNIVSEYRIISRNEALDGGGMFSPDFVMTEPFNRYDGMMRSFADMVSGRIENPYSYEYEATLQQLLMQACRGEA